MSGYLRPCMLNYCDSVSQYLCIITVPYWSLLSLLSVAILSVYIILPEKVCHFHF